MSLKTRNKEQRPLSGEEIVDQYFKCITDKDVGGILDLFDYDGVLYEPFSKMQGLRGHAQIEPFLKVAMMANTSLKRAVKIEKTSSPNRVTAQVLFEKGSKVSGTFAFEFTEPDERGERKIKSLRIEFP